MDLPAPLFGRLPRFTTKYSQVRRELVPFSPVIHLAGRLDVNAVLVPVAVRVGALVDQLTVPLQADRVYVVGRELPRVDEGDLGGARGAAQEQRYGYGYKE